VAPTGYAPSRFRYKLHFHRFEAFGGINQPSKTFGGVCQPSKASVALWPSIGRSARSDAYPNLEGIPHRQPIQPAIDSLLGPLESFGDQLLDLLTKPCLYLFSFDTSIVKVDNHISVSSTTDMKLRCWIHPTQILLRSRPLSP
jgi:hypothetical protein